MKGSFYNNRNLRIDLLIDEMDIATIYSMLKEAIENSTVTTDEDKKCIQQIKITFLKVEKLYNSMVTKLERKK